MAMRTLFSSLSSFTEALAEVKKRFISSPPLRGNSIYEIFV